MTQAAALTEDVSLAQTRTASSHYALVGLAGALIAFSTFLAILATGHLDEDAYILLTYSEHLASGHGIVWDLAHGPAEGATDFLWMILIAGWRYIGLDVAAAAALLNAAGFAIAYFAVAGIARLRGLSAHLLLGATLLVSHITAASLGGFSTLFYCGVFAVACYFAVQRDYPRLAFALLALGLVRPDGVLLAAGIIGAVAIADWLGVWGARGFFLTAIALAAAYFAWRWWYFGLPFPLPLLVKSHTLSVYHGVRWNMLAVVPLVGVIALIFWQRRQLDSKWPVLLAGPVVLFVFLCTANQMQNLAFRFQAPITLAIVTVGFCAGRSRIGLLSLALLPWLAFGARAIDREVILITQHDYVNYFPQMLSPAIGSTAHVAMTEAGRLGYRLPGSKLDIVGLNSKITALGMDRVAALAGFRPDMVFLHQVWTLDTSKLDLRKNWIELSREQYAALPVLDSPADAYHTDPTHVAALAARRFVLDSPTPYFIYAVQYRGEFSHFFFLRGDGGLSKAVFEGTLDLSFLPEAVRPHCAYSDAFPCRWLARHG